MSGVAKHIKPMIYAYSDSQYPGYQQERLDHILHKQVFGIAITEMTG